MEKFKIGDLCYGIEISDLLIVKLVRAEVWYSTFNECINEYTFNYRNCYNKTIRTYQIPDEDFIYNNYKEIKSKNEMIKRAKMDSSTISGGGSQKYFYTKNEITLSLIKNLINDKRTYLKNKKEEIESSCMICYFTGEKLKIEKESYFPYETMDGPTNYFSIKSNVLFKGILSRNVLFLIKK